MANNTSRSPRTSDDRVGRLEEQLYALRDAPGQLETILNIVTGLEAAIAEMMSPVGRALLQSSAVSRNRLWGRLKRHGSAPSIRPTQSLCQTHSPASSRRVSHRKGTESSVGTTRTVKDLTVISSPAKIVSSGSPRILKKSRSFESLDQASQHPSEGSETEISAIAMRAGTEASVMTYIQGVQAKVSNNSRRGSRSTSAPSLRRPSFGKLFGLGQRERPSLGNESLSKFVARLENHNCNGSESPTHPDSRNPDKQRPSVHSETGVSGTSSRSGLTGFTHSQRRPSGFSDLSPKVPPFNHASANATHIVRDLPRIDSEVSYFAGEKWMRSSSFKLESRVQVPSCMFLPYSWYRLAWDGMIMTMTVFLSFVIPMGLVYFDAGFISDHALRAFLVMGDFFWLIDVAINIRTGFFYSGTLILDPRAVAEHYAKCWLALDVIVLCPAVALPRDSTWSTILQMLKLLRILKFVPAFSRLQKRLRNAVLMPVKLIIGVSLAAHLIACMWRAVQWADETKVDESEKWQELYVKDMYWVLMTMTTVGYGDIHPTGFRTRIYAIIIMMFSSLCFGAAITTVSHLTRSFFNDDVEDRIAKAATFLRKRHIPRNLQQRVVSNLRHQLHQSHLSPAELFSQISPSLHRELSLSFLSETVLKFPLFKIAHHSCVAELAQAHLWVECFQNDLVSEPGQIVEEVVFVVHGHLVAFCPQDASFDMNVGEALSSGVLAIEDDGQLQDFEPNGVDVELNSGAWFGEACLLSEEERIRVAAVMSVCQSELAILKQKEYQRIIGMFPQLLKQHQNVQQGIRDGALSLSDLAFKPRPTLVAKPSLNKIGSWLLRKTKIHAQVSPSDNQYSKDENDHS